MDLRELEYELPESSIAQTPSAERGSARLLCVEAIDRDVGTVAGLPELVPKGALVVLNDTRVRHARLLGRRGGGGEVEFLLLHPVAPLPQTGLWRAMGRGAKRLRPGERVEVPGGFAVIVETLPGGLLTLDFGAGTDVEALCSKFGQVPLPPYIRRPMGELDAERYQTVFARALGSAAAPTAGLHLTQATLERLVDKGVCVATVTLHVGLGTFLPVRTERLEDHRMHHEQVCIPDGTRDAIASARLRGAPVVAVGTTVVRALESAADSEKPGHVLPMSGQTDLMIAPGYRFKVVDSMLTNFHAPRSTLLALVGAFVGQRRLFEAYRFALAQGFRFLSYGDAMWVPRRLL